MTARRIVITGGTAGIGLATAHRLRAAGHGVFICGRDPSRLEKAIEELGRQAGTAPVGGALCDVRELSQVREMIGVASRQMGGLDGLVNNAGSAFITEFGDITPSMWSDIIATNLTGVFNCCHAALDALKKSGKQGAADIVNVGSRSGRYAFRGGVGYNTTKFGLQGLTEAMFLDLSRFNIRVGLVAPGTVSTGLGGTAPADWHLRPEDVAEAVAAMIGARDGAALNWVELRPARPPL
ncbi:MAG: SDR family NAD(P)-dependent oxidoreductase [Proteobacteria bacterium]|nr:SDR family NAD(P)-dependent oxidoreductase [Pseudomonadota bacterium]